MGHGMKACTIGLWMSTALLEGEDYSILLVDTQGVDSISAIYYLAFFFVVFVVVVFCLLFVCSLFLLFFFACLLYRLLLKKTTTKKCYIRRVLDPASCP